MSSQLYTADQIAERLSLHVKTIRRYIREGRLKGKRIGKEYRVAANDLDEFAGSTRAFDPAGTRERRAIASSIVDIDAIGHDESQRMTTLIMAALNASGGEHDFPRVDSIYFPERAQLRVTISANPVLTAELLRIINALLLDTGGSGGR